MPAVVAEPSAAQPGREQDEHKPRKRHREAEADHDATPKHKKHKSDGTDGAISGIAAGLPAALVEPPPMPVVNGETQSHDKKSRGGKKSKARPMNKSHPSKHATTPDVLDAASAATPANASLPEAERPKKSKRDGHRHLQAHDAAPQASIAMQEASQASPQQSAEPQQRKKRRRIHESEQDIHGPSEIRHGAEIASGLPPEMGRRKKHKKKHQLKHQEQLAGKSSPALRVPTPASADLETLSIREEKKNNKKRHKTGHSQTADSRTEHGETKRANNSELDQSALGLSPSKTSPAQGPGKESDNPYPFFTQTISQYLPLFPSGMIDPLDGYADQHLRPLVNRYVPAFHGVLLGYRNLRVGAAPGSASLTEESDMDDVALLESVGDYAVSFGWLTVDVDLFQPMRGSWLEGTVNLQSEGHLGVVCWGKFNASIEAGRLPDGWRWIDLLSKNDADRGNYAREARLPTPDPFDEGDGDLVPVHTTGHWVDEAGRRVRGLVRFRIKNYEVGTSGDYGYLSIEGTMLEDGAEKAKAADELEELRRRRLRHGGLLRKATKPLPAFSVTKFSKQDEEDET